MRGEWGHLGTFEFAIGSRCLERSLDHLSRLGIKLGAGVITVPGWVVTKLMNC